MIYVARIADLQTKGPGHRLKEMSWNFLVIDPEVLAWDTTCSR